jgi:uncharacterized membrane protein YgcG
LRRFRTTAAAFLIAVLALAFAPTRALAQFPAERIRSYSADIRIEKNGAIAVVERIGYDFDGFERHGIYRDIPNRLTYDDTYDRVFPIEVRSVTATGGAPDQYETFQEGPNFRIRIGDPDKTISGIHTYTISYEVRGALNPFIDHDELYWNALGTEWMVPVLRASARVTAPAPIQKIACFAGPLRSSLPCEKSRLNGDVATFSQDNLNPFEGLTVVVALPPGSVVPPPAPILNERWSVTRAFGITRLSGSLTIALLILLLGAVLRIMWVNGRDRRAVGSPVDIDYGSTGSDGQQAVPLLESGDHPVEFAPPDGVRPGQVGTLVDEVANPLDVTSTIVDLAVRGYLRIEEIEKTWIFGKEDWNLVKLKDADDELLRYERVLLDGLFEDTDGQVKLSGLKKKFVERLHKVQEALYVDAVKRRWFAERPDKVRGRWVARGIIVLVLGGGLTYLLAANTHFGLVALPVVLAGLLLLVGAHDMPRRTPKGTGMVRRVRGFRTYIDTAETREMQFQEKENIFSRYLPYAVVFGLTEKWAAAFAGLGDQPPDTSWYIGTHPFTVAAFTSSISSFSTVTAGTIASTPGGSGSSGFGGGGSSGGGGGGGGGGSW